MTVREDIVNAARSYIGTRFRHRGRDRFGVDCIGLLILSGRDCGLEIEDSPVEYKRTPDGDLMKEMIRKQSDRGAINCIKHGSIIMLKQAVFPCHCGVVDLTGGQPKLIHASMNKHKVVEEALLPYWRDIIEVREYRGID